MSQKKHGQEGKKKEYIRVNYMHDNCPIKHRTKVNSDWHSYQMKLKSMKKSKVPEKEKGQVDITLQRLPKRLSGSEATKRYESKDWIVTN